MILSQVTGIKIKHVPYKGGGEYIPALLGGHLDFVIGTAIATLPQESAGKLRTLALMGANKMKELPAVPTTVELGIKRVLATAAALVELLAQRAGQLAPAWTDEVGPLLEPVFLLESATRMKRLRALCESQAPEPLRKGGLYAPPDFLTFA